MVLLVVRTETKRSFEISATDSVQYECQSFSASLLQRVLITPHQTRSLVC